MVAKKTAKKAAPKKAKKSKAVASPTRNKTKSVEIQKVSNGFIVSQWQDNGMDSVKKIAKNEKEAKSMAADML